MEEIYALIKLNDLVAEIRPVYFIVATLPFLCSLLRQSEECLLFIVYKQNDCLERFLGLTTPSIHYQAAAVLVFSHQSEKQCLVVVTLTLCQAPASLLNVMVMVVSVSTRLKALSSQEIAQTYFSRNRQSATE